MYGGLKGGKMKTKSLATFHILLWIVPPVLWTVYLCLNPKLPYLSWAQWIYAGLLPIFGPYATLLGVLGDLPNAGKLFNITWAIGLTIPIFTVAILPYIVKPKWIHIICCVLYGPLILFWLAYGIVQIGSSII